MLLVAGGAVLLGGSQGVRPRGERLQPRRLELPLRRRVPAPVPHPRRHPRRRPVPQRHRAPPLLLLHPGTAPAARVSVLAVVLVCMLLLPRGCETLRNAALPNAVNSGEGDVTVRPVAEVPPSPWPSDSQTRLI